MTSSFGRYVFLAHVFVMNRFRFLSLELFSGIIIIRDEDRAIHTQVKDTTKYYHSSVFQEKRSYISDESRNETRLYVQTLKFIETYFV